MPMQTPPPPAPHVVTHPDWLRKPDVNQFAAVWPEHAARRGMGGKATLLCKVTVSGALHGCSVKSESPAGEGFGNAALLLAPNFAMKPGTIDGRPVETRLTIPIAFDSSVVAGGSSGVRVRVMTWAPWSRTPSLEDVRKAYPPKALAARVFGSATFRCSLASDGALRGCDATQETPERAGFEAAGRKLLPMFRAEIGKTPAAELREMRVVVTTRFSSRLADPGASYSLTEPDWFLPFDPGLAQRLYPPEARAAKVASGRAVLDCGVAEDGALAGCKAVREEPAGLGFGAAAAQLAAAARVNGWTRDGERAAGARVVLPIRIKDAPEAASASAAR